MFKVFNVSEKQNLKKEYLILIIKLISLVLSIIFLYFGYLKVLINGNTKGMSGIDFFLYQNSFLTTQTNILFLIFLIFSISIKLLILSGKAQSNINNLKNIEGFLKNILLGLMAIIFWIYWFLQVPVTGISKVFGNMKIINIFTQLYFHGINLFLFSIILHFENNSKMEVTFKSALITLVLYFLIWYSVMETISLIKFNFYNVKINLNGHLINKYDYYGTRVPYHIMDTFSKGKSTWCGINVIFANMIFVLSTLIIGVLPILFFNNIKGRKNEK